ncbi:MAG: PH domain-containing protein [Ruminococcus sp.]|nr:PH domain-containing protein [Ruminococcus sp.]
MKKYRPDRNGLITLRIAIFLASLILFAVVRYYIPVDIIVFITTIAIVTADIFFIFIYLPLYFRSLSYSSDGIEITRHSGVIIKKHQTVCYSAVQYITIISTPFSQYTGLNFIVFFVYGGQMQLAFLDQKDAAEILSHAEHLDIGEV